MSLQLALLSLLLTAVLSQTPTPSVVEPVEEVLQPDNVFIQQPSNVQTFDTLQEQAVSNGCNPNVCFMLDGGRFVDDEQYKIQRDFVTLIAAIVGADVRSGFASVQYTRPIRPISLFTTDTEQFLLTTDASQRRGTPASLIDSGMRFCIRQLRGNPEDVNKIVIIADGRSFFRGNPQGVARRFLRQSRGHAICAIGIGFGEDIRFLERITGGANRVFDLNGYFELLDVIDQLVAEICGLDG